MHIDKAIALRVHAELHALMQAQGLSVARCSQIIADQGFSIDTAKRYVAGDPARLTDRMTVAALAAFPDLCPEVRCTCCGGLPLSAYCPN